ncbi:hypothetical protein [Paenibacillus apiarius]|uniref:Uncharacterized protein n=1 Tax=Paenibacillus apiarius TaxID=46240 RepID=A0ABT4DUZ8_9BACL|nr:hypothetical protein [Paenibacillus apiarius]MCY9513450.1 hypothetical protein [Paenibacillus apiarius]MCY9521177.1 hypothetical protein [Paenibacillus apiarius]MCY9553366.1 hypothetical protein [Paenibacillus apiarius]MCY9559600.1 hypothetical protein [Paenibacillus apiarius]MCY9685394.1 hypothetical protein [Paenibacillus apiarius]
MFKLYHENEQFNLQMNRMFSKFDDPQVEKEIAAAVPKLIDTTSWYEVWKELGEANESAGKFEPASSYFQAAEFYLPETHPDKKKLYEKYRENYYKAHPDLPSSISMCLMEHRSCLRCGSSRRNLRKH